MSVLYRAVGLALLLSVGACIGAGADLRPPRTGDVAPDFQATALEGGQLVSLADYQGGPVLVNLWATWCGPCRFETPYLESVYEEYQDRGLKIAGVSVDSRASLEAVEAFLADNGVTYDILLDPDMVSTDVFAAIGLPASFLIGADGVILFDRLGPILEEDPDFLAALEDALN